MKYNIEDLVTDERVFIYATWTAPLEIYTVHNIYKNVGMINVRQTIPSPINGFCRTRRIEYDKDVVRLDPFDAELELLNSI